MLPTNAVIEKRAAIQMRDRNLACLGNVINVARMHPLRRHKPGPLRQPIVTRRRARSIDDEDHRPVRWPPPLNVSGPVFDRPRVRSVLVE
jgi:hypothetical protein